MTRDLLSCIRADCSGTGMIEFAFLFPVLALMFAGMVDMSLAVAARIDAELVAQRGTDFALAVRPNVSRADYIRAETANAANIPAEDITVDIYLECDGVRQGDFDANCPPDEDQARLVTVTVSRKIDTLFDWTKFARWSGARSIGPELTVTGISSVRFQ